MWVELALAGPSIGAAFCARKSFLRGLRRVPVIKSALPAPRSPQPTTIVAEMLALQILKELPYFTNRGEKAYTYKGYTLEFQLDFEFTWHHNSIRMRCPLPSWGDRKWWLEFNRLHLWAPDGKGLILSPKEKKILMEALAKCYELQVGKAKADAEQTRQEKALEAIEVFMGIKETSNVPDKNTLGLLRGALLREGSLRS